MGPRSCKRQPLETVSFTRSMASYRLRFCGDIWTSCAFPDRPKGKSSTTHPRIHISIQQPAFTLILSFCSTLSHALQTSCNQSRRQPYNASYVKTIQGGGHFPTRIAHKLIGSTRPSKSNIRQLPNEVHLDFNRHRKIIASRSVFIPQFRCRHVCPSPTSHAFETNRHPW